MQIRMFNTLTLVILVITYYRVSCELSLLFQAVVCILMLIASVLDSYGDN